MKAVCVFAGSNTGADPAYAESARLLAYELVRRDCTVVFGGGNVGLMGVLADSAIQSGGRVIGVIPSALVSMEVAHGGLAELHIVDSMHERKALMADLSDGFVALPGGLGTLEELFEIVTWLQLGLHSKPLGLLDPVGYYRVLLAFLDHAVAERFMHAKHREALLHERDAASLLDRMKAYEPPTAVKWLDRDRPRH